MLSSNPSVPLHSIEFHDDNDRRRLSLRTHTGQEYLTAHDGLPSPEHLTPVSGTPLRGPTPDGSHTGSAPMSRMGSELATESSSDDGAGDGGREGIMSGLQRAPSRRTAGDVDHRVSLCRVCVILFRIRSSANCSHFTHLDCIYPATAVHLLHPLSHVQPIIIHPFTHPPILTSLAFSYIISRGSAAVSCLDPFIRMGDEPATQRHFHYPIPTPTSIPIPLAPRQEDKASTSTRSS